MLVLILSSCLILSSYVMPSRYLPQPHMRMLFDSVSVSAEIYKASPFFRSLVSAPTARARATQACIHNYLPKQVSLLYTSLVASAHDSVSASKRSGFKRLNDEHIHSDSKSSDDRCISATAGVFTQCRRIFMLAPASLHLRFCFASTSALRLCF